MGLTNNSPREQFLGTSTLTWPNNSPREQFLGTSTLTWPNNSPREQFLGTSIPAAHPTTPHVSSSSGNDPDWHEQLPT